MDPIEIQADAKHTQAVLWYEDYLLTCGIDKIVKVWDPKTWQVVAKWKGHLNSCNQLIPLGETVVTSGSDGMVRAWENGAEAWSCKGNLAARGNPWLVRRGSKVVEIDEIGFEKKSYDGGNITALGYHKGPVWGNREGAFTPAGPIKGAEGFVTFMFDHGDQLAMTVGDEIVMYPSMRRIPNPCKRIFCVRRRGDEFALSDEKRVVITDREFNVKRDIPLPIKGVYGLDWNEEGKLAVAGADGKVRIYESA